MTEGTTQDLLRRFGAGGKRERRKRTGPGYTEPGRAPVKVPREFSRRTVRWLAHDGSLHRVRAAAMACVPRARRGDSALWPELVYVYGR